MNKKLDHELTESEWIRRKLDLSENATLQDIQKKLHVVCSHAAGYNNWIKTYKCDRRLRAFWINLKIYFQK